MKRAIFIAIPLLITLALAISVTAAVFSFPLAAQQTLDLYFTYNRLGTVQEIARSARPWYFSSRPDYPTYGDSWCFETDLRVSLPTKTYTTPVWQKYFNHNSETTSSGLTALPYPPEEVWCVLADLGERDQVLFVARHHVEPYQTDWVIHEGPQAPFSQAFLDSLNEFGCELGIKH